MTAGTGILDKIVAAKRRRLDEAKLLAPLHEVREQAARAPVPIEFGDSLRAKPGIAVIAEMKRSSPSAGELDPTLNPAERAQVYSEAGAAAISVLTEADYFRGALQDLRDASEVAHRHGVAVLEKDFVFDEYQVYEARAAGADAVLLIIAILEPSRYRDLFALAGSLGMDALVEVFDEAELETALTAGPSIVGVNNRHLKTLKTSLSVFEELSPRIPAGGVKVAESGMKSASDVERMGRAGAKAVLVGESLMRAGRAGDDVAALVSAMSSVRVGAGG
jgi:indole-3-glycerol phosphate synthase